MQARLLRALEESKIKRLGGTCEVPVDARVLAATNRPIESSVRAGTLRADLYYRLNVIEVHLPPLRERKADVPLLAKTIVEVLNRKHDCRITGLHPTTLGRLMAHSWPGNIRELRNVLEYAAITTREGVVMPCHLPDSFRAGCEAGGAETARAIAGGGLT